jgi:hypothetical protein
MKQIRITTQTGESVHVIAKGSVPQLIAGELTVALHDGTTLRLPIQAVNGYVVEDAKRPTKLDKLAAEHAAACEAVETAAEGVYAFARGEASVSDETFRDALDAYVHAVDDRAAALDALKAGQIAAARAKERAEKRKASGEAPKPKKPAVKKAAKK